MIKIYDACSSTIKEITRGKVLTFNLEYLRYVKANFFEMPSKEQVLDAFNNSRDGKYIIKEKWRDVVRPFVFAYLLAVLGAGIFFTVQYSFWVACMIVYISTMTVVAVISYVGGSRPSWKSKSKLLKEKPKGIVAERQSLSEDRKVA